MARLVAFTILAVSALSAQTFETASIRQSAPASGGGPASVAAQPLQPDPTRINYTGVTLNSLLSLAYGVRPDQITGPRWLGDDRFDIAAAAPTGTTSAQAAVMLQHLLQERFHMTVREETKPRVFYALVPAKGGVKMKAVEAPELRATVDFNSENIELKDYTMVNFANFLTTSMHMPVVDETGLQGSFDITLYVSMADIRSAKAMIAIRQLGLNFEKRNAPTKLIFVDKAEKIPADD